MSRKARADRRTTGPTSIRPKWLEDLKAVITQAGGSREAILVTAPFSGAPIGAVPAGTESDVHAALERAGPAQQRWARRPFAERRAIILRYHDQVLRRREELLDLMQLESGKARRHALEEVLDVAVTSRYYARQAEAHLRSRRRQGALPLLTATWEHHHPAGTVGLIAPWNYPLTLAVSDAVAALMAGNAVILKPASETPFTALLAVQMLREAGLPPHLFQVVTGPGRELGPPLIAGVDFVGFTGSTASGRRVAEQASAHLTACSLELGGKNPMIVLDDADLKRAVEGAVQGCFANAGQLCLSFERLYVQRGVYDRFLEAFVERARALRLGAAYDYATEVGSLISQEQLTRVEEHVQDARQHGAEVLTGGTARPDLGPCFFAPTILRGGSPEMKAARQETFGPVVTMHAFDEVEDAVQAANDTPYGLNASLWTRRTRYARRMARRLACGTVNINDAYAAAWGSVDAPMGGMKASGLGRRHGRQGILKYTEAQTVAEQRGFSPMAFPEALHPKTYADIITGAIGLLRYLPGVQ